MRAAPSPPLIITADSELREHLTRACAAGSVRPELVRDPIDAARSWDRASCVLVGADAAAAASAMGLSRRAAVILAGCGAGSVDHWRSAVALGADQVVMLPGDEAVLIGRLTDAVDLSREAGLVVGVTSASGGAGSSTFALCLGSALQRRGGEVIVVDADAVSGGLQLLAGCEAASGLRWPDLLETHGRVTGAALRTALPRHDGVAVLSTVSVDQPELPPPALRSVVVAASRGFSHVVADLPRIVGAGRGDVSSLLDVLVIVATTDARSIAGAARIARSAAPRAVRLVVRTLERGEQPPHDVAESLGLELLGAVRTRRAIRASIEQGLGPVLVRRDLRNLDRLASVLLRSVGPAAAAHS